MVSDDFEQRVGTTHINGDLIVSTDTAFPALAKKGTDYALLEIDASSGGLMVDIVDATGISVSTTRNDTVWSYDSATLVKDTPNVVCSISPGTTKKVVGVLVSGFGYCEWTLRFGTTSSEAVIAVIQTSPSGCSKEFAFPESIEVTSTETFLVSGENKENAASTASDFIGHATIIYE